MAELDKALRRMEKIRATELYLMVGQRPKFRIDGDMVPVEEYAAMDQRMLGRCMMDLVTGQERERLLEHRDLYFIYSIEGKYRFRCNYFFQQTGYAAVIRPIPSKIPTFAQLKLPSVFKNLTELPSGLVLIAGPPGCGKTTSLAAIVDSINENQRRHVLIIEKPLEFLHKSNKAMVVHREVGVHTESFNIAVLAFARQDVDVALISEFHDPEVIFAALKAAATGTLVFAASDASSAAEAIDAVTDAFPAERQALPRNMLAESFRAVVVQELLSMKGSTKRIPACEILLRSDDLANAIRQGDAESLSSLLQSRSNERMRTIDDSLAELVEKDIIDGASAHRKSRDKERFAKYVTGDHQ